MVLAAAALLFVLYRANAPKAEPLVAVVDFGDGITETIPLDKDHDYLYDVGDYIVHLQVRMGPSPSSTVSARTMCASNSAG